MALHIQPLSLCVDNFYLENLTEIVAISETARQNIRGVLHLSKPRLNTTTLFEYMKVL